MLSVRYPTPSERVILAAIYLRWKNPENRGCFNVAISDAAHACGVSYARAEWLACRAAGLGFPSFGRGLGW